MTPPANLRQPPNITQPLPLSCSVLPKAPLAAARPGEGAVRCRANGRRPTERGPEAGTVPPALPARLTAGVGAAAWAGAGGGNGQNQEELRRLERRAQPRAVAGSGGASSSCGAEDSVDGGAGLWLRTWRPPRPAPSAASTAPASSRGSDSDAHAHAHSGPLRRPPVSRTAQPSQQPPAAASRRAHARRPHPQPSPRPFAPSEPPRETLASVRARLPRGLPALFLLRPIRWGEGRRALGIRRRQPEGSRALAPAATWSRRSVTITVARNSEPSPREGGTLASFLCSLGSQPSSLPASPRGSDRLGLLAALDFGTRTPFLWR